MGFFLLLNTKEDIMKNVGNQTVDGPIDFHSIFCPNIQANVGRQLSGGYQYSLKHLLLCLTEERNSYRIVAA